MQSVELLLDDPADRMLRSQWDSLVAAGLPSQGRVRSETNRPHITVGVAEHFTERAEAAIREAVGGAAPVVVRLGDILVFGRSRYILARHVVVSPQLTRIHDKVTAAIGAHTQVLATMAPGSWTPHITLARRLNAVEVGRGLAALRSVEPLHSVTAVAVRRWDGDAQREWLIAR